MQRRARAEAAAAAAAEEERQRAKAEALQLAYEEAHVGREPTHARTCTCTCGFVGSVYILMQNQEFVYVLMSMGIPIYLIPI